MTGRENTSVAFQTLGCKVNQYESEKLAAHFSRAGYRVASNGNADVLVVNTCTVTGEADRKSRQMIRRMARGNPRSLVVVTGCHAAAWSNHLDGVRVLKVPQLEKETLFSRVDELLFGTSPEMPDTLEYHTTPANLNRERSYLKVQDGCDRFCTYCIIPYVRGRSRSRALEEILTEAHGLIEQGIGEIVITGICVGDYGRDLHPRQTLSGLLEHLLEVGDTPGTVPGLSRDCPRGVPGKASFATRFRFSSFDPCDMDEKLFDLLTTHPRVCRHLHLALQHGSDRILKRMGRDYTRQEFFVLCRALKKRAPDFAITTDILVGFPGETEDDFRQTLELAEAIGFSKIHVFPYSERKQTGAVKHPNKVPVAVRDRRVQELIALSARLSTQFYESQLGTVQNVLVERERDRTTGRLTGYTSNYIPMQFEGDDCLRGQIAAIRLKENQGHHVSGDLISFKSAI